MNLERVKRTEFLIYGAETVPELSANLLYILT